MDIRKLSRGLLTTLTFLATVGGTSIARADETKFVSLREELQEIEGRSRSLHELVERAAPSVRRDAERIVAAVDRKRASVSARIDMLELVGESGDALDRPVLEMRSVLGWVNHLLAIVEGWFGLRR